MFFFKRKKTRKAALRNLFHLQAGQSVAKIAVWTLEKHKRDN